MAHTSRRNHLLTRFVAVGLLGGTGLLAACSSDAVDEVKERTIATLTIPGGDPWTCTRNAA